MSFCNRIVEIPGSQSPVFLGLKTASQSWGCSIAFSQLNKIEAFLNSLNIGDFSVLESYGGYTIETVCNNIEFTAATYSANSSSHDVAFTSEDCQDVPCKKCEDDCFDDLVGLRDVCSPGSSCIFLNDLGISRYTLEQIITKDYSGPEDFFAKQYASAVDYTVRTIHGKFEDKYMVNSIIEGQRLGFVQDNMVMKASNSKQAGIFSEMINTNSYLDFYVSEISLFTDYTGPIQVNVYDIFSAEKLGHIVVNSIAGKISKTKVYDIFKSQRKGIKLFFAYDTTGINSYKTLIKDGICCGNNSFSNQYISSQGAYANNGTFLKNDIKSSDHTFGMSLVYSLQCNHRDWLCSHKNLIALPIAYRQAANIMQFATNVSPGERVNTKITISKKEIVSSLDWYDQKFTETIESILKNIQTPSDAKCFQCRRTASNKLVLP